MSIALFFAALMGFLASYGFLQLGLSNMAVRYPLATCVAYAVFLLLLRVFARYGWDGTLQSSDSTHPRDSSRDSPDSGADSEPAEIGSPEGASSDFEFPLPDLDEGLALLVPLLMLAGGIVGVVYIIHIAPVLLAELILDAVVVASLARRYRQVSPQHWIHGALRNTYRPFLGVVIAMTLAGFLAHLLAPGSDSIGDLFRRSGDVG